MATRQSAFALTTLALLGMLATGCQRKNPAEATIASAATYLWSKQAADGGWHSETIGLLASGQSLTAQVLWSLLQVPEEILRPPQRGVEKALAFLESRLNEEGALGFADESLVDYPNYASALLLRCLRKCGSGGSRREKLRRYLEGQQFGEAWGWKETDPVYGGWGMGGQARHPPVSGQMDLSMTRYVLEALGEVLGAKDPGLRRAQVFLGACQNPDGGFVFTLAPGLEGANKAGRGKDGRFRSYGSTTADGILALLATGAPEDDKRVQRALVWLREHHRFDQAPGMPEEAVPQQWAQGLKYYYLAASSQVLARFDPKGSWHRALVAELAGLQKPDGSFANPQFLVKENDPLIATSLALVALCSAVAKAD